MFEQIRKKEEILKKKSGGRKQERKYKSENGQQDTREQFNYYLNKTKNELEMGETKGIRYKDTLRQFHPQHQNRKWALHNARREDPPIQRRIEKEESYTNYFGEYDPLKQVETVKEVMEIVQAQNFTLTICLKAGDPRRKKLAEYVTEEVEGTEETQAYVILYTGYIEEDQRGYGSFLLHELVLHAYPEFKNWESNVKDEHRRIYYEEKENEIYKKARKTYVEHVFNTEPEKYKMALYSIFFEYILVLNILSRVSDVDDPIHERYHEQYYGAEELNQEKLQEIISYGLEFAQDQIEFLLQTKKIPSPNIEPLPQMESDRLEAINSDRKEAKKKGIVLATYFKQILRMIEDQGDTLTKEYMMEMMERLENLWEPLVRSNDPDSNRW